MNKQVTYVSTASISLLAAASAFSQIVFPYTVPTNPTAELDVNLSVREPIEPMNLSLNYGARSFHAFNVASDREEFRRFDPPSTRWPIGVWANWYNWETDSWETDTSYPGGYDGPITQYPQKKYGFPGFTQLHDEMNFDVLWSFNVDYDSPEKGAARMNDRFDKGFDLEWIELGNEIFWVDQRSHATATVELYEGVAQAHSQALKAEDPYAQLAVPASWRDDSGTGWNGGLTGDQSFYDAITVHKYIRHTSNVTVADIKEVMKAGVVLKDTADDMAALFPGKPQWYSEWGVTCGENALSVLAMNDIFLTFFKDQNLFAMNQYHQVNGMDEFLTSNDDKTAYGAAYDVLRAVFENSELYEGVETATMLDVDTPVVQSAAVNQDGKVVVYAQNKTPNSIPFTLKFDGVVYSGAADHHAFAFSSLNDFPFFEIEENPLTEVAMQTTSIVLPPYSMNVISGLNFNEVVQSEILLEAESAEGQVDLSPFEVQMELGGHTYLTTASGSITVNYNTVVASNGGLASYQFELLEAGEISVELLAKFPGGFNDSFWYRIDGGTWTQKDGLAGGSWKWVTLLVDQNLAVGNHTLQIARREVGVLMDRFRLTSENGTFADPSTILVSPFENTRIEAEGYDEGGLGVGYHDRTAGNSGNEYRTDNVDIQVCSDIGGGYNIGWMKSGEWLRYSVEVEATGSYNLLLRTARQPVGEGSVRILLDDEFESGDLLVPSTGNWDSWADVETSLYLSKGKHQLKVKATSDLLNLNYLELMPLPLPSPWVHQDIGGVGIGGGATFENGTMRVFGSGNNIAGQEDQFHSVFQTVDGSCELVAQVTSIENTHPGAKAGVMIRETLDPGSRHFAIFVTPEEGIVYSQRTNTGGYAQTTLAAGPTAPCWLKIERVDNTFKGSYSLDGVTWVVIKTQGFLIASETHIGLAVSSRNNGLLNEVTFQDVSLIGGDKNGNTIPDVWELQHFGNLTTLAGADSDGDGFSNLEEYVAGTVPTDANSSFRLVSSWVAGSESVTLEWEGVTGRRYRVLKSATLDSDWLPISGVSIGDGGTLSLLTNETTAEESFYRIEVIFP